MTEPVHRPSGAERAGRSLVRALKGLFGAGFLHKARESAAILKHEFEAGKRDREADPPETRKIAHREPVNGSDSEERPPAPEASREPPTRR